MALLCSLQTFFTSDFVHLSRCLGMSSEEDFEYSDSEIGSDQSEEDILNVENKFYEAESLISKNYEEATQVFRSIIRESPSSKWTAASLAKLFAIKLKKKIFVEAEEDLSALFLYQSQVPFIDFQNALNSMFQELLLSLKTPPRSKQMFLVDKFLSHLASLRLYAQLISLSLKLCKVLAEEHDYLSMERYTTKIKETREKENIKLSDGSLLELEFYCLECLYSLTGFQNKNYLKDKCCDVIFKDSKSVSNPRIMSKVFEIYSTILLEEENFLLGYDFLRKSLANYVEIGSQRAQDVGEKLVIYSLLSETEINPFSIEEVKSLKGKMSSLRELREAFDSLEYGRFLNLVSDEIFLYQQVKKTMQKKVIIENYGKQSEINLRSLGIFLKENISTVEALLKELVSQNKLSGAFDHAQNLFIQVKKSDQILEEREKKLTNIYQTFFEIFEDMKETKIQKLIYS
eukprot:snap_masked-scaffold_5-processed-gene-13.47-mRNA-1 protein AED:1.00 eAED:1.00 QI:0/-1/0/0/-1/1/1/0/458